MKAIIEHSGLMAKDTNALAAWYCSLFSFKEIFRTQGSNPTVFLSDEQTLLEIFPYAEQIVYPESQNRKVTHLCIRVEDFDEAIAQLKQHGVSLTEKPFTIFGAGKIQFFTDPEGHWLHLVHRPQIPWSKE